MEMKTEGERSEKNLVKKKKKKQKKEPASGPENDTVDDESPTEVKKEKKKNKKVETVVIENESSDVGDEKEKRKNVNDSLKDARGSEPMETAKEGVKKKKKKKQPQQEVDDMNHVEIAKSSVKEEVERKERKEKKVKKNTVQSKAENVKIQKEEEQQQQAGKDEEPKTAKKRKNNILSVNTEVTEEPIKEKKKKKKKTSEEEMTVTIDELTTTKKTAEVGESGLNLETIAGGTEGEEVTVKKKKKNKNKAKSKDENGVETPEIKRSKAKKTETDSVLDESGIFIEEEKTEPKKKGKGRKASVEVTKVEDTEPQKKKRKRGGSKGEEEPSLIKCEEDEEADDTTSKKIKKKKRSAEVTQAEKDVGVETGAKKKKKIKKEESSQMDVGFLSEKSGNTDEINITQERRQELQIDIDKAPQPEKPAKPSGLGQWSTAQFKSSDQQQKFLRLMGGFKKGFQPAAASTDGANMAMGKDAQQQLQQGLLGEFERAHSRRMDFSNRGAGLGFTAPSNKKFSIDISASRSTRFDD